MRLSLCVIARNEEAMLPGLLASVKGVVDELILVDTGSTDGTIELARAAGATVIEQPWDDDFARPRTTAVEHATGDWVLQLDADERLAPGAGRALKTLLQRRPTFDCGLLALHNAASLDADPRQVVSGHARLSDAAWLPRLLRRVEGLRYRGVIHESVLEWVHEHRLTIARVPGVDVVHLGAVPSLRAGRGKSERNIALLRKRCALEPDSVLPCGYLALELVQAERFEEAHAVVEAGWPLVATQPKHRSAIRLAVARGLLQLARGDGAGLLETAAVVERHEGTLPDLVFLRACGHELRGELAPAASGYAQCLETKWPVEFDTFIGGSTGWNAAARLGGCAAALGRWSDAQRAFARALQLDPSSLDAKLGLVEVALGVNQPHQALREVQPLLGSAPDGWVLASHAALLLGARADACLFLEQARQRQSTPLLAPHRAAVAAELARVLSLAA